MWYNCLHWIHACVHIHSTCTFDKCSSKQNFSHMSALKQTNRVITIIEIFFLHLWGSTHRYDSILLGNQYKRIGHVMKTEGKEQIKCRKLDQHIVQSVILRRDYWAEMYADKPQEERNLPAQQLRYCKPVALHSLSRRIILATNCQTPFKNWSLYPFPCFHEFTRKEYSRKWCYGIWNLHFECIVLQEMTRKEMKIIRRQIRRKG